MAEPTHIDPRPLRFWTKVDLRHPDECWPWLGAVQSNGYGRFGWSNRLVIGAHRACAQLTLELVLPTTSEVDHKCHNADSGCRGGWTCLHRRCVNPNHLRVVTRGENVIGGLRGMCRARLHVMAESAVSNGRGARTCGECRQ